MYVYVDFFPIPWSISGYLKQMFFLQTTPLWQALKTILSCFSQQVMSVYLLHASQITSVSLHNILLNATNDNERWILMFETGFLPC